MKPSRSVAFEPQQCRALTPSIDSLEARHLASNGLGEMKTKWRRFTARFEPHLKTTRLVSAVDRMALEQRCEQLHLGSPVFSRYWRVWRDVGTKRSLGAKKPSKVESSPTFPFSRLPRCYYQASSKKVG